MEEIIKEFEERFPESDYSLLGHGTKEDHITGYTEPDNYLATEEIKDFIRKALTSQREEIVKRLHLEMVIQSNRMDTVLSDSMEYRDMENIYKSLEFAIEVIKKK